MDRTICKAGGRADKQRAAAGQAPLLQVLLRLACNRAHGAEHATCRVAVVLLLAR